jgi:hypothetical protein
MAALAEPALAFARAQQVNQAGILGKVKDWSLVDSTTVTVCNALREAFAATGEEAAVKVHKVLSVGCGAPLRSHFRPAQEHDRRHLEIEELWRGCGLLADLAYASLPRLRACNIYGVHFVTRLRNHWKPRVDISPAARSPRRFCPGTDLDALIKDHIRVLDDGAIDADVRVGSPKHALHLRLVGVHMPQGYGFFLTNLPLRIGPRQAADRHRLRWEVNSALRWTSPCTAWTRSIPSSPVS